MRRLAIVIAVAGCAHKTGSGVSGPLAGKAVLGDRYVSIPVTREHHDSYEERFFKIDRTYDQTTKVDALGDVVVDLRGGACVLGAGPPARESSWLVPAPLADGRRIVTPSGRAMASHAGKVWVDRHPLAPDPDHHAVWLPGTNLVVTEGGAVDASDGTRWPIGPIVAKVGDALFAPTRYGIVELSSAPHRRVALHAPPSPDPAWLDPTPWPVGEEHAKLTLIETPQGTFLEAPSFRIFLGAHPGTIDLYEAAKLAAGDGIVVDLETRNTLTVAGRPRIAKHEAYEVIVEAGGKRVQAHEHLAWWFDPAFDDLHLVGFDGRSIVFQDYSASALVVFDAASRSWRTLRYGPCMPRR